MLATDWPVVEMGDPASLEAWKITSFDDTNTERGRVHITTTELAGVLTIDVYKTPEKLSGDRVATGSAATGSRATLSPVNGSRFAGSVYVRVATASATIILYLALVSETDLAEAEDRLSALRNTKDIDFGPSIRETTRAFIRGIAKRIPPPILTGDGLRFSGSTPIREAGRQGRTDDSAIGLWSLNVDRLYEITGLANVSMYAEWAREDTLFRIWKMKAAGGGGDSMLQRADYHRLLAAAEWKTITPWVVASSTREPDRPVQVRSMRARRG